MGRLENMEKESLNHLYSGQPIFSVITITYNAGKVLERTLLSVLQQSYPGIEYIIIDGGSTDETLGLIKQYAEGIACWMSEPDEGLYDAMNKGMRKASGDYLLFLNAGDTFQSSAVVAYLAQQAEIHHRPDILYGETDLVDIQGNFAGHRRLKAPENLNWKSFRMGMLVCHQAFVVKRELAPFYDLSYRFSADFDWCIRCMKLADSIQNTHRVLILYLNEGLTTANRNASLKERYRIMQKYYGKLPVLLLHIWFAVRFYWAKFSGRTL